MKKLTPIILFVLWALFFSPRSVRAATYYFHSETSQGTARILQTDAPHTTLLTLSSAGNVVADTVIGNWETTPLGLTSIPAGTYTFNVWANKTSLLTTAFLYAKVYVNNTTGTLIGTTASSVITPMVPTDISFSITTSGGTTVATTDRLFIEMHINVTVASLVSTSVDTYYDTSARNSHMVPPFSGALTLSSQSSTSLTAATLSSTNQSSTGSLGTLTVVDGRETDVGWTLAVSSNNFTCCSPTRTIAVTNLTINPGTFTTLAGSSTGVAAGSSHTFTSTTDQTTVLSASSPNGRGAYSLNPSLILTVPVGSYAGSYSATITETVS